MGTGMRVTAFAPLLALTVAAWPLARLSADEKGTDKDGFVPLFGTPTWTIHQGEANTWAVTDDGTIFTRRGGGGWLMTKKEYADFELRLEVKLSKDADTGITFRSSLDVDAKSGSINQIQFADEEIAKAKNWPSRWRTGGIFDVVGPQKEGATKPAGEWNDLHIVARGHKVTVDINGTRVLDVDLEQFKDRVTQKKEFLYVHPDLLREKGHIGLQSWNGLVEFRKVRIKELR